MSRLKALCVVLSVLSISLSAGAATIWSDDFESGLIQWSDTWTAGTGIVQVEANPSGVGNVLHIRSDEPSDKAAARASIGTTLNQTNEFHVQFDVYFPTNGWMQTFRIFSAYGQKGPDVMFRETEDHRSSAFDYTVDVQEDAGYQFLTNTGIPAETWTTVLIEAPGDGTYSMYIGNYSNYIGTFDLRDGDWYQIFIGDGNAGSYCGEYYIDDMIITDTHISVAKVLMSEDFESGLTQWSDTWTAGTGTVAIEANPDGDGNVFHLKADTATDQAAARSVAMGTTLNQTTEFHAEFDLYFPTNAWMQTFYLFGGETSKYGPAILFRQTEDHRSSTFDYTLDVREESDYQLLASTGISAETWTKVYMDATGDGTYDLHIGSYSNFIGNFDLRDGDWTRINFGDGSTSSYSGEFYMDNILITDTFQNQEPLAGYTAWIVQWGGTNVIGSGTADYDEDGLNNLYEYGLGGDPTDDLDQGTAPQFSIVNVGGSNMCSYIYGQLSDPESGLAYSLALATDLVAGNWVTNAGYLVTGTNVTSESLDFVTNVTDTVDSQKFIRLIIE